MLVRVISSVTLFPVLFFLVYIGGLPLKIGTVFVSLVGMYEFYKAIYKKIMPIHYIGFILTVVYLFSIDTHIFQLSDLIFRGFLLISMVVLVFYHKTTSIFDVALTFFGVCYIPVMFSTVYLMRAFEYGKFTVWLPFLCAWSCDTGAYFTGITMGKHKLTPELSPKKTIEGAIGGIVFSALFSVIYVFLIFNNNLEIKHIFNNKNNVVMIFLAIGIIGAIFAQFGDLTASAIKRRFNIKDYGRLIPGHGGILDRFDSVIFTSGICYIILKIIDVYYFNKI